MTLRLRVVLLTLLILLPAIGVGAWLVAAAVAREHAVMETRLLETTRALSLVLDREVERRVAIVQLLAASPQAQDLDFPGFCKLAKVAQVTQLGNIALIDRQVQYVNTLLPDCGINAKHSVVGAADFTEKGSHLSDLFLGAVSREPLSVLSVPLTVQGQTYNVALAIRPPEFQRIIDDQNLPQSWGVSIVNQHGTVLARRPDPQRWVGTKRISPLNAQLRGAQEGALFAESLDGIPSMVFFNRSPQFGLNLLISVPQNLYFSGRTKSVIQASGGAVLLLLLGGCTALWVGRRVAAPIEALQTAASDLEAGRVVSLPATPIFELQQVGDALVRASERISASNAAMQRRVADAVSATETTQARLVQSQKLEAIGRLTGGIAHDFNNLLQTLSTGLHVLDLMVHDAKAKPLIDAGKRAVNRGSRLVQQLLLFGRHVSLSRQPLDFRNHLLSMEALLTRALPPNIHLHSEIAPDLWAMDTDASQLEVALLNLVFNARDAMEKGGILTIRAFNDTAGNYDQVVIEVSDTGTGISAELLGQIFEPFFTTKAVGRGTGLGLSQVRTFAEQSGGSATARSIEGAGTTITLRLPWSTRQPVLDQTLVETVALRGPCRLLMVEDDVMISEVVSSALVAAGFTVVHARTGDEALALLQGGARFDVVFSDVVMPGAINGVELATRLARDFPSLPVVLTSGYAGQVPDLADTPLLTKPYSVQALVRALVEVLPTHV
jgi:signal transduction histidine kinase